MSLSALRLAVSDIASILHVLGPAFPAVGLAFTFVTGGVNLLYKAKLQVSKQRVQAQLVSSTTHLDSLLCRVESEGNTLCLLLLA